MLQFLVYCVILVVGSVEKSADFLVPNQGRKFMNSEKAGIGSVPPQQGSGKPGTFQDRKKDAVKKGHVPSLTVVATPKGPAQLDYKGDLQVGSNRPANF